MRREAFTVEGAVDLVVRAPAGLVEIDAVDTSEAVVELVGKDDGSARAVEEAVVELRQGSTRPELVVDIQHGFRVGGRRGPRLSVVFGRGPEVRVAVRVPKGSTLDVSTDSANVRGTGTFATADIRSAAGDLRLDEIAGEATIKSVSGDVAVAEIGGKASVSSVSGDAKIDAVVGAATVHSVSGDIEVGEASSSLHMKTISGAARVASAAQGTVTMQSVSGDLTVGVRAGSKLWVDARSTSGNTSSELKLGDEPPANGGPMVEVTAKSVSGDIRIVRA
jgi:DUF4097 and DUF4098 domain-containing protein YvlB